MKQPAFRRKITSVFNIDPDEGSGGDLPRWNLGNLYPSLESEELEEDRNQIAELARQFRDTYEGTVNYLSGEELGNAIAEYEVVEALRHKMYSYAFLLEQENSANIPKTENLKKFLIENGDIVSFFEGEINEIKEPELIAKLGAPELAAYAAWVAGVRSDKNYLMEGNLEGLSRDINAASIEAMNRLYDRTMAEMRVTFKGRELRFDEANSLIGSSKTSLEDRAELRREMGEALKKDSKRVAFIYNTIIKSQAIDATQRRYDRPDQEVNIENRADSATVDALFDTVKGSYTRLSNRYFRWKAEQHGVEMMKREQVPAALPDQPENLEKSYSFDEAKKLVLRAFRKFTPKFARIAQKFFDEGYIDAEPRPGKDTGGFAMPTGPANFPYILINYTGKTEDVVSSLGHELGHGIHQALAEKARGNFLSEMPTTIAETASIFAEMLVFEELLKGEKDPALRKKLLMEKVEGMLDNSLRQIAYYDFEKRVHEERKRGELDAERISDIWVETQKGYFGPAVELDTCDRYRWMTVPHFFGTPFYVYSYSFAQVAVSGLFQVFKQAEKEGPEAREEFISNYIGLLETGITKNLYEMFRPFDMNPETPEFWDKGLSLMEKYLDDLAYPDAKPSLQEKFNRPEGKSGVKSRKPKGPNLKGRQH